MECAAGVTDYTDWYDVGMPGKTSKPTRIKAVVFDLDDTLFPERQYVRSGYRAVARQLRGGLNLRPPAGLLRDRRDLPSQCALLDWMWRRFLRGERSFVFDALSDRFGLALSIQQIDELVQLYRRHTPAINCFRGVRGLLGKLRRRRLRLGLVSDGYLPAQTIKFEACGLARYFHAQVFTEKLGREAWKPSPRGFELIRRRLGVPHEACAYVADNPAKDFVAPNALGWMTVQWLRPGQLHSANAAPAAGQAKRIVRTSRQLLAALGL